MKLLSSPIKLVGFDKMPKVGGEFIALKKSDMIKLKKKSAKLQKNKKIRN